MATDDHPTGERPLLDPTAPPEVSQASLDQIGAALGDRVLAGLSAGLAAAMTKRTLEAGPWLLMGDGRLYAVTVEQPNRAELVEMLRRHVLDWGRCDHADDCECSDATARRALAMTDETDEPDAHPFDGKLVALFLELADELDMISADDDVPQYRRDHAGVMARRAHDLLKGGES